MAFNIDIISAVPQILESFLSESILKRGIENMLIEITDHNLRKWSFDKHHIIDDTPYGGKPGMIIKIEPLVRAIKELQTKNSLIILTTPSGKKFEQKLVRSLLKYNHLIIICGHYKGIDARIHNYIDLEISIGDFILTGGELPAAIIADSVCRLVPGVISDIDSANGDSFENGLLDCDYYTRPLLFEGNSVPEVLTTGNHELINKWKLQNALKKTERLRPDLYEKFKQKNYDN